MASSSSPAVFGSGLSGVSSLSSLLSGAGGPSFNGLASSQSIEASSAIASSNQIRSAKTFFFEVLAVGNPDIAAADYPGAIIGSVLNSAGNNAGQPTTRVDADGDQIVLSNQITVNLSAIKAQTQSSTNRPVLFNISLSDYVIEHEDNTEIPPTPPDGFQETDREVIVLQSSELTQGRSRYMTVLGSDAGIGLFGSNSIVLQELPDQANIKIGFINPFDVSDNQIYDPNTKIAFEINPAPLRKVTFKKQWIKYALLRFNISVNYL